LAKYLPEMKGKGHANLVLMDQFGVKEATPEMANTLLACDTTDIIFYLLLIHHPLYRNTGNTVQIQSGPETRKKFEAVSLLFSGAGDGNRTHTPL
jgi:hypothetical protein